MQLVSIESSLSPVTRSVVVEPVCFSSAGRVCAVDVCSEGIRTSTQSAEALAEVLPILLCGEESATISFSGLRDTAYIPATLRAALASIAIDERRHESLLWGIRRALPLPQRTPESLLRVRRFFMSIGSREIGRYLAQIAGLDSAVCTLLGHFRARRGPLASDQALQERFTRIHADEARHVATTRYWAMQYCTRDQADVASQQIRRALVRLLTPYADSFEVLGVDCDRILPRLRQLPSGLFA